MKQLNEKAILPLMLPMIILADEMSNLSNTGYFCSLELLRKIEESLPQDSQLLSSSPVAKLRSLNEAEQNLLELHQNTMDRQPQALVEVVNIFERTIQEASVLNKHDPVMQGNINLLEERQVMASTINFYKMKLQAISADVIRTLSRIDMIRATVQNLVSITLAEIQQQRNEVQRVENLKYSRSQRTFSTLGVLFLPGTFFAVSIQCLNIGKVAWANGGGCRLFSVPHSLTFKQNKELL